MLDIRQEVVRALAQAVRRGGQSLGNVPGLLRRVIEENMWGEREIGEGEKITLAEFREFVEKEYPEGLGTTIETLEALCRHEPDIIDFLAQAKRGKVGRPVRSEQKPDLVVNERGNLVKNDETIGNVNNSRQHYAKGNSTEYSYNRLRDEAYQPDGTVKNPEVAAIHQRVIRGEISPNAGMVQAGFRPYKVSINMQDAASAARTVLKCMDKETLRQFIELLQRGDQSDDLPAAHE